MAIGSSVIGLVTLQAGTNTSSNSDPFESISSFFDSGLWSFITILLRIFVVLLWLALAYWTYQDARRRIESPGVVAACVALSVLIPFLGSIIYLIVRPPEYLDEARERELELLALEQRLGELGDTEGQQIVGRMLAREGLAGGDPAAMQRALRQAGVASADDVRDLDQRLTELEFRLRLAADRNSARAEAPLEGRTARAREMPKPAAESGETGRTGRWRRPRDQESYD
jgi:hypothetical protein